MKKITGLVGIAAVLVLGSYYGMGVITENAVQNNMHVIKQFHGLSAELFEYKRGWFKSQAILQWKVSTPEHTNKLADGKLENIPAKNYQVQAPLEIYHGPFIISKFGLMFGFGYAYSEFRLPINAVEQFNNLFTKDSIKPQLVLSLFVDYLNNSDLKLAVPSFKLISTQKDLQFDWRGMFSSAQLTSSKNKIDGNFVINGIRFLQNSINTIVGKITGKYNLHKTKADLFLGDVDIKILSIVIKNSLNKLFELQDFNANLSSDIKKGLFDSQFKIALKMLDSKGKIFGPGNIAAAIRNIDASVLVQINEQVQKIQQAPSDVLKQQAILALLPELPKLLNKGAEFEISELSFIVPEGSIEGSLLIVLPKENFINPLELLQKVRGESKLKLPTAVLKEILTQSIKQRLLSQQETNTAVINHNQLNQTNIALPATPVFNIQPTSLNISDRALADAEKLLNIMINTGVLVQQGDYYSLQLRLEKGRLTVNSKPFTSSMLTGISG